MRHKVFALFLVIGIIVVLTAVASPACKPKAAGPDFPQKDITWVVPYAAGGGYDVYSRVITGAMPKYLPKPVHFIIDNKEGGGGAIGFTYAYKSPPDGHTVVTISFPGVLITQLLQQVNYDLLKAVPIGCYEAGSPIIVVKGDSPIKNLADLKAKDKIKYGCGGLTTSTHYAWVVLAAEMGITTKMTTVTGYKGVPDSLLAVFRGEVDVANAAPETALDQVKHGDLRVIAVVGDKRLKIYPDTPTTVEQGYPEMGDNLAYFRGVWAPPGTPDNIAKILEDAMGKAIQDPEVTAWQQKSQITLSFINAKGLADVQTRVSKIYEKHLDLLKAK